MISDTRSEEEARGNKVLRWSRKGEVATEVVFLSTLRGRGRGHQLLKSTKYFTLRASEVTEQQEGYEYRSSVRETRVLPRMMW